MVEADKTKVMILAAAVPVVLSLSVFVAMLAVGYDYHALLLGLKLRHGSLATQRTVAAEMAAIKTSSGVKTAIHELIKCLNQTHDEHVRLALIVSLADLCRVGGRTLETERATQAIIAAADSRDFQATRAAALMRLGLCARYHSEVFSVLDRALKSSERDISQAAMVGITFLCWYSSKEDFHRGVNSLLDVLENDDRPEARSGAAWSLSNVAAHPQFSEQPSSPDVIPALNQALLKDKDENVRRTIAEVLVRISERAHHSRDE